MKETIVTIPINDLFAPKCGCPLCRMEEMLEESQKLNFKRWNILNQMVHENYQALGSYSKEVGTVRTYITKRLESLDNLIQK